MPTIREIQAQVHQCAVDHGWWDGVDISDPTVIGAKLALIHSEVSEALECVRDAEMADAVTDAGKPVGFASELADVVIRVMDLAGAMGIDLESAIELKHSHNLHRPSRHGGKAL